jgi:hypothetical protein
VQPPASVALAIVAAGALKKAYAVTAVVDATGEESTATLQNTAGTPTAVLNQDTGSNIQLTITAPASGPTPNRYNVYASTHVRNSLGITPDYYGYIGTTATLTFIDTNYEPDFLRGPPAGNDVTSGYGNFGCNAYFQGRQFFAATSNYPHLIVASAAGNFKNMGEHFPLRADDAFAIFLLSTQVNAIKHLVSLNSLLALTADGAWLLSGDSQDDAVTALSVRARPQQYNGISDVPPLNVSSDVLYVQDRGAKVRTLAYDFNSNLFTGIDITVLASHFFYSYTITETSYCEEPFSLVHCIRSDGAMPVLTYLKDQDIYAWALWTTGGDSGDDAFISVASIPESGENVNYVVVKRIIPGVKSGAFFYMIERIASRDWLDDDGDVDHDAVWALDSAVSYSNPSSTTLTGLHHLVGADVVVYADGGLLETQTVAAGGTITIEQASTHVLVGLPYTPVMQTLRLDLGEPSVQGKRKKVAKVTVTMNNSRGIKCAQMRDDIDGNAEPGTLYELKERSSQQTFSSALPFITGTRTMALAPGWQKDGSVYLTGTPGLPCEILALTPTLAVGDDNG